MFTGTTTKTRKIISLRTEKHLFHFTMTMYTITNKGVNGIFSSVFSYRNGCLSNPISINAMTAFSVYFCQQKHLDQRGIHKLLTFQNNNNKKIADNNIVCQSEK